MTDAEIFRRAGYRLIAGGQDWPWPFNLLQWWFNQVWAWAGALWDTLSNWIVPTLRNIAAAIGDWGLWLRDRIGEIVGAVWSWVSYWSTWLRDRVGEIVGAVWSWISYWSTWLRDRTAELAGNTWQLLGNLWSWLAKQLGDQWSLLGQTWGWLSTQVPAWFGWLWSVVERKLLDTEALISTRGSQTDQTQRTLLDELRDYISHQLIDPWTDWLRSTTQQFIGGMSAVWTGVTDWLSGAWQWALNIVRGPILDAATGALGWLGDRFADVGRLAFGQITDYLFSHSPVRINEVANKSRDLLLRLAGSLGGLLAMTLGGELLHPLKNIGLGRVAAMVYNFTRYDTIVDNYVRPLAQASIGIPLRWYANDLLRPWRPVAGDLQHLYARGFIDQPTFRQGMAYQGYPDDWIEAYRQMAITIPSEGTLGVMYAKKEISAAKLRETLGRWGYSEEWQSVFTSHLWLDPRLGEIIRISQISPPNPAPVAGALAWLERAGIPLGDPADWWYTYKLAKAGYEPIDVSVLVGVAKMGVVRREQTMYFEASRRLRRDGFISDARYEQLIAEAWIAKDPVTFRRAATALDVEYDRKESLAMITRRAYSNGALAAGDALALLGQLGMDPTAARIQLLEERVGLLPRTRLALATRVDGGDDGGD